MECKKQLILVCGLPRSGTTVVGDIIAAPKKTVSLYEPLNPQSGDFRFNSGFIVPGVGDISYRQFDQFVDDVRELKLKLRPGVFPHETGWRKQVKRIVGGRSRTSLLRARLSRKPVRIVWKDPFAVFCIDSILQRGDKVLVTYRPPNAIAASYKRLNWTFDIDSLKSRIASLDGISIDVLHDTESQTVRREVQCAVFLWLATVQYYLLMINKYKNISIVSTGHLPNKAKTIFPGIFKELGIEYDCSAQRAVNSRFKADVKNLRDLPSGHPHSRNRDINKVNDYWSKVLSKSEIKYVAERCHQYEAIIASYLTV